MNKKLWIISIIILIVAVLAMIGYSYIRPLYNENRIENIQADILSKIKSGDTEAYGEYMYCDRCVLFPNSMGYSHNNGEFEVKATVYIDDSEGIEKVELKMAMEYDYIQYKENYEDYIVMIIDITDDMHPVAKTDNDNDYQSSKDDYIKYSFDVSGTMTEEDGFNIKRGIYYAVVVTFSDGYQAVVFY